MALRGPLVKPYAFRKTRSHRQPRLPAETTDSLF